ncbi:MAG: cell division protein SepF, partial [Nocardioidaceae bacterium]
MAGAMRKMGVYLGLVEGADRYDEIDEGFEDEEPTRSGRDAAAEQPAAVTKLSEHRRSTPIASAPPITELSRITTLHPRTYN